jgi:hypothetical protein
MPHHGLIMAHKTIIELFEQNELDVSRLYGIYADIFPKHADFWSRLSQEEIEHAHVINDTRTKDDLERFFASNALAQDVIRYVNNYIKERITEAKRRKKLTHIHALCVALRIERSTVEDKCLDIFIPNSTAAKRLIRGLNKETRRHIRILTKELEKCVSE